MTKRVEGRRDNEGGRVTFVMTKRVEEATMRVEEATKRVEEATKSVKSYLWQWGRQSAKVATIRASKCGSSDNQGGRSAEVATIRVEGVRK